MISILSPHLDDACLSLGQFLATEPGEVEVITVLAGAPDDPELLTPYDQSCGFTSSRQAMGTRQLEDRAALKLLGARARHLQFLDGQYATAPCAEDVVSAIEQIYSPEFLMFAPLGIGHPDHRFVAAAAREAVKRHVGKSPEMVGIIAYEELPYRVLHPEEVTERLAEIRADGWIVDDLPWPLEQGDRYHRLKKSLAIELYRSQFKNGADDPSLLVPERCWRITPDVIDCRMGS